jgi:two-component system sensor histidine kinase UhpB
MNLRWRPDRLSLQWRVFAVNAAVFVVAVAILAWTPVTVHKVATPSELVVLAIGLVLMLAFDLLLLRRAFRPLRRLALAMRAVDPMRPGERAESFEQDSTEVRALAAALNRMLERLETERRESALRELGAQERERARIARELHDEVGQMLTAIALRAERAAEEPDTGQRTALLEISQTALGSLEDVRRIGRELRPEALDDLGLVNALIALCGRVDRQRGLRVRRVLDWQLPDLAPEVELVIYRVVQEALTNVLRHSDAKEAIVKLSQDDGCVLLEVLDNGRGLAPGTEENGLRGMRERALVIDAKFDVQARAGGGTHLTLRVPV